MADLIKEIFQTRAKTDLAYLEKTNWKKLGLDEGEFERSVKEVFGKESAIPGNSSGRLIQLQIAANLYYIAEKETVHWRRWLAMLAYGYYEKGNLQQARKWGVIAGEKQFVQWLADKGVTDKFLNPDTILLEYLCGADWDPELLSAPTAQLLGRWGSPQFNAFFTKEHRAAQFIKSNSDPIDKEMLGKLIKHFIDENESAKGSFVARPEHPGFEPLPTALAILSKLSPDDLRELLPEKYHRVIGPALMTEEITQEVLTSHLEEAT